ncbi:hypothetical protein HYS31_07490 [Candidatus Woesearchaeota archaeon]|nr:hypothetical protein [Candidatus Woesearchaeota archaeon]
MGEKVEKIYANEELLAVVVRHDFDAPSLSFVTPDSFPFQLGVHFSKAGTHVKPHRHIPFKELKNLAPQEFFYLEKGKVEVGIYHKNSLFKKIVMDKGDMIVLNCAHELVFLEDSKLAELKQGPYRGKDAEKEYIS